MSVPRLSSMLAAVALFGASAHAGEAREKYVLQVTESGIRSVPCARLPDSPAVGTIESGQWSPNDPVRDGAREFEVLLKAARLAQNSPLVGLVGVGNRAGLLRPESERALERLALMGVPVVKVATRGEAPVDSDNLFIEAGSLSASECETLLARCLTKLGALPSVKNPFQPTEAEKDQLRRKIEQYQLVFATETSDNRFASK